MVTYRVMKIITFSTMIGQCFDTVIVALSYRVVIITHQNLSARNGDVTVLLSQKYLMVIYLVNCVKYSLNSKGAR